MTTPRFTSADSETVLPQQVNALKTVIDFFELNPERTFCIFISPTGNQRVSRCHLPRLRLLLNEGKND